MTRNVKRESLSWAFASQDENRVHCVSCLSGDGVTGASAYWTPAPREFHLAISSTTEYVGTTELASVAQQYDRRFHEHLIPGAKSLRRPHLHCGSSGADERRARPGPEHHQSHAPHPGPHAAAL